MNQRFSKWIPGTLGVRLGGKLNLICNDDNSQMEPNGPFIMPELREPKRTPKSERKKNTLD